MYPAIYLPRWLSPALARADPAPPWQRPFLLAYTGIRGIVSLAAALAIPLTIENGQAFPHRDLILFLTFSVILVTLVGQGLMLPTVIRALGLARAGHREHAADRTEEYQARRQAAVAAMGRLDQLTAAGTYSEETVQPKRVRQHHRLEHIENGSAGDDDHRKLSDLHDEIELLLINAERSEE